MKDVVTVIVAKTQAECETAATRGNSAGALSGA